MSQRVSQAGQVYTDEASGVAAHQLEKSYGSFELDKHTYRKHRDKKVPRDAEVLAFEEERLHKSPSYD